MDDCITEASPDRNVLRMLVQQIAVAKFDGLTDIERAARRALRAYQNGRTTGLDPEAKEALDNAHDSRVLIAVEDEANELDEAAE